MNSRTFKGALAVLTLAMLVIAATPANAAYTLAPITAVTGSNGGDRYGPGMPGMINGSGMDRPELSDPSTWSRVGGDYQSEWMAWYLTKLPDPPAALNSKQAWASFDLGGSTALADLYLWNNTYQSGISGTQTYNLYYADSPTVALPPMPAKNAFSNTGLTPQGDYDFSSGGWTKFNTLDSLSIPKAGTSIVDLSGISARYIALEIITNYGDTYKNGRVGLSEVAVTRTVPEMIWTGASGNWNASQWDDGTGTIGGPVADAVVTIDVAATVTVDAGIGPAKSLSIGEGGVASGLIVSNPLTVTLDTTVGANSTLNVNSPLGSRALNSTGTVTIAPSVDMSGVGTVNIDAGSVTGTGALTLTDVNLNAGTLAAGGLLTVDALSMAGGAVSMGAHSLTVNNTLTLTTDSIDTTAMGTLDVSGADVTVQGGSFTTDQPLVARSLTVLSGSVDLGGQNVTVTDLTLNSPVTLGDQNVTADNLTTTVPLTMGAGTLSASNSISVTDSVLTVGHDVDPPTLVLDGGAIVGGAATATAKYSFRNIADYSADITGATAELIIGEDRSLGDHQVTLTGNNTYGGKTTINRGVLEVAPNAANLGAGQLEFYSPAWQNEPAILQTSGTFARQLGAANGLYFHEGGGFAATDENLTVTLTRADGQDLPLLNNYPHDRENGMGRATQWGSPTATAMVELTNDISNNYHLNVRLFDNPNSSTDIVLFSGDITNPSNGSSISKAGPGTLWLTGTNSGFSAVSVGGGNQSVIRAVDGVGLSATAKLNFNQGVFESSGTFTREIGSTAGNGVDPGQVDFGNHGGFSAYGGPLTVSLAPAGGAPGDQLTWNDRSLGFNNKALYMGSPTANDVVTATNDITNNDNHRYIYVSGNPDSDADHVVFSGDLTGFVGKTLYVRGTASPGAVHFNGSVTASNVRAETGATLGGNGTITGNLVITSTSAVAPGDGVGTLNVTGNTTLPDNSIYEWEVGQDAETDVLNITGGTLDLDDFALKILDADGYVADAAEKLPVFTYDMGSVTVDNGFAGNFDTSALDEGKWDWSAGLADRRRERFDLPDRPVRRRLG